MDRNFYDCQVDHKNDEKKYLTKITHYSGTSK